jgi:two-component system, OmpR family, sensor kinase
MRLSLRSRVLAAAVALVVAGLTVAGVATYAFLRSFLLNRVDQQLLVAAEFPAANALREKIQYGRSDHGSPPGLIPSRTYCAFVDSAGRTRVETALGPFEGTPPRPVLPSGLPGSAGAAGSDTRYFTTGSAGPSYRGIALAATMTEGAVPGTVVIAIPLTDVNGTLHRLLLVELGVAAAVLVAVGAASWWLIRLGLRPLDRMAATAGAIAGGDLSRRVQPEDDRTEVGRLGRALNTMLGQIEASFRQQRASEERLRRFIGDASHELRTPITSIRGYAELFRRGAAERPEDLDLAMRRIEDEGARMGVLVDDLLLLARLDQGRPLERRPVDLRTLVTDAVHDARAADPGRHVEFEADGEARVLGDEMRLRQVVANVLENARTHTPPATPVSVRLRRADGSATIEVADRGPGLSSEDAERVFERFYRGDLSRSRARGGAGLGLSIAAAIVEAHGGRIRVWSIPGEGATFVVSLPLAQASGGEDRSAGEEQGVTDDAAAPSGCGDQTVIGETGSGS